MFRPNSPVLSKCEYFISYDVSSQKRTRNKINGEISRLLITSPDSIILLARLQMDGWGKSKASKSSQSSISINSFQVHFALLLASLLQPSTHLPYIHAQCVPSYSSWGIATQHSSLRIIRKRHTLGEDKQRNYLIQSIPMPWRYSCDAVDDGWRVQHIVCPYFHWMTFADFLRNS